MYIYNVKILISKINETVNRPKQTDAIALTLRGPPGTKASDYEECLAALIKHKSLDTISYIFETKGVDQSTLHTHAIIQLKDKCHASTKTNIPELINLVPPHLCINGKFERAYTSPCWIAYMIKNNPEVKLISNTNKSTSTWFNNRLKQLNTYMNNLDLDELGVTISKDRMPEMELDNPAPTSDQSICEEQPYIGPSASGISTKNGRMSQSALIFSLKDYMNTMGYQWNMVKDVAETKGQKTVDMDLNMFMKEAKRFMFDKNQDLIDIPPERFKSLFMELFEGTNPLLPSYRPAMNSRYIKFNDKLWDLWMGKSAELSELGNHIPLKTIDRDLMTIEQIEKRIKPFLNHIDNVISSKRKKEFYRRYGNLFQPCNSRRDTSLILWGDPYIGKTIFTIAITVLFHELCTSTTFADSEKYIVGNLYGYEKVVANDINPFKEKKLHKSLKVLIDKISDNGIAGTRRYTGTRYVKEGKRFLFTTNDSLSENIVSCKNIKDKDLEAIRTRIIPFHVTQKHNIYEGYEKDEALNEKRLRHYEQFELLVTKYAPEIAVYFTHNNPYNYKMEATDEELQQFIEEQAAMYESARKQSLDNDLESALEDLCLSE